MPEEHGALGRLFKLAATGTTLRREVVGGLTTFVTMAFSIAHGVAAGIVTYPIVKRLSGRGKEVHHLIDLLAVLFIAKFLFLD